MNPDNEDFFRAIAEYGFDPETVRRISENTNDMTDMPDGSYKFRVSDSALHGLGVIATSPIAQNETVGPSRIKGKRTPLGRYTNHAKAPNGMMRLKEDGDVELVATIAIEGGEEITIDYRQAAADVQKLRFAARAAGTAEGVATREPLRTTREHLDSRMATETDALSTLLSAGQGFLVRRCDR